MKSLSWVGVSTAVLALPLGGCDLVAGIGTYCEVGVDCPTSGTGGTGTGGATGGGSTGTAGTGGTGAGGSGTGGTGGGAFACVAAGAEFEIFPASADMPSADRLFIVSVPDVLPPRAHFVRTYDESGGHIVVRTLKGVGMLGPAVPWDAPPGAWSFGQGAVGQNAVSVFGSVTTAAGPTVAQVKFSMDAEQQVQMNPMPQFVPQLSPDDCPALTTATIDRVAVVATGTDIRFAATFDNCVNGTRRLYYGSPTDVQQLREGTADDASLVLADFARSDDFDALLFSDGSSSYFSGGSTMAALSAAEPITLGDAGTTSTVPQAMVAIAPSGFAFWWGLLQKGAIVPATLYGGVIATSDQVGQTGSYDLIQTYSTFESLSRWSRPSVGAEHVVVGALAADASTVRFSVLGLDAKPLVLDQVASSGAPGQFLDAAASHFGGDVVVVTWISVANQERSYRGRAFTCK